MTVEEAAVTTRDHRPPGPPATSGDLVALAATHGATAPALPPGAWPRCEYIELEAVASAVPLARRHVRDTLATWALGRVYDAEMIASELLTNAIAATEALPLPAGVSLLIAACRGFLIAAVRDASHQPPVRPGRDDDAVTGRGLAIVAALSTRWGWAQEAHGKVVWALLDLNRQ